MSQLANPSILIDEACKSDKFTIIALSQAALAIRRAQRQAVKQAIWLVRQWDNGIVVKGKPSRYWRARLVRQFEDLIK